MPTSSTIPAAARFRAAPVRPRAPADVVPGRRQVPPDPQPTWWRTDVPTRPAYLRSVAGIEATMRSLESAHPDRARVVDIGDSERAARGRSDGHDILALLVGDHVDDLSVPRVLMTAGVHAREIANPELLLRWAERTLAAAASGDAARSALLGARTVALVPLVNPDGYDIVTRGLDAGDEVAIWRRTNANPDGGVDLNRNFDAFWAAPGERRPGTPNYPGTSPASESETRAVQSFVDRLRPAAAYDWHSAGEVVLYPWGHTPEPPAAIDALLGAARVVSAATGYPARSSWDQWSTKTSATMKDWAHARHGIPALTIETGTVQHQDDAQLAATERSVMPAIDELVATVDGRHAPPRGAEALVPVAASA